MDHGGYLFLGGFHHFRVTVPGTGDTNAGCKVQVTATFRVNDIGTFAFGRGDAGSLLEQGGQFAFVVGHGHLPK